MKNQMQFQHAIVGKLSRKLGSFFILRKIRLLAFERHTFHAIRRRNERTGVELGLPVTERV